MAEQEYTIGEKTIVLEGTKRIPIYIMGKRYEVLEGLTIMKALEFAGYQIKRGCGCRAGICGACATVYRLKDDYRLRFGLACQTTVEPDMYLTQIPFVPANKTAYNMEEITPDVGTIEKLYPETFRCLACNTCTKACPMEIPVMDYIQALMRGDIAKAAELSHSCIMCGMCSMRCPAEIQHFHVAMLARRLYGKYIQPKAKHLAKRVEQIEAGKFEWMLDELEGLSDEELKQRYKDREWEPEPYDPAWKPQDTKYLILE
ncbi:4Fe-4S dicluster domain-containing protein [Desulfohalobiaceae bacterium Ax17]|uniref:4Fe-4S dicluster domain-containing protein n=1 Tax=Desulfovulcanus ferrireducens TaxID=2831190 RepID=UPI00207BC863|nr:4Fe-4S dicluster domain-containing protein [Desulfovulcanus ferrireducens]MBT8764031.1 4Fe-4S dicluster domain-containing protein [Desulfovulcanus ferrireducens]